MTATGTVSAGSPLLEVRGLTVSFENTDDRRTRAVDGVSFTLHRDQTLAIVGESGSGKSVTALSLLRLLSEPPARIEGGRALLAPGLGDPSARPIDLLSLSPADMRRVRGGQIAMIFQEPMTSLNPLMTVGDQVVEVVRTHSRVSRREAIDHARDALVSVGIADALSRLGAYPHEFSGGMRQRVMIAMALAGGPRVLLADEPTTALDVTMQAQILDLIDVARHERGMGVVLITHDLGVVARRADVLCVMYAGRVVEYGATTDVLASPLHPYTSALIACRPTPASRRDRLPTVRDIVSNGSLGEDRDSSSGLHCWWPGFPSPPGVVPGGPESVLVETHGQRWARVWATPAALSLPSREPDVPSRRSIQKPVAESL